MTPLELLLVEADPKESEVYVDLIREVTASPVDVLSRVSAGIDWSTFAKYQLIIVDLSLSSQNRGHDIDAISTLENIKRASPETSVILISNRGNVREAVTAIRMGAEDYFEKPFNLEEFKLAVKRALDRNTVFGQDSSASAYFHLVNSCQMVSASLEQERIFEIVRGYFSQELLSKYSAIYQLKDQEPLRVDRRDVDQALDEIIDVAVFASNPFEKMVQSGLTSLFVDRGQLTPGLFVFRFRCVDAHDYFCVCLSPTKPNSNELFESQLTLLRRQIEVTGNNIREYMGVKNLVYLDEATGLYNTRYLNFILDREIKNAQKRKVSFAVLFIDVDHFKNVNDQNGHMVGTRLLNELGARLKTHVRDDDTVFRYGGDEFVAVLSPCDLDTAKAVASRIRESVEMTRFLAREGLGLRFTVSIGVALFPDHAQSKKEVIKMADDAMYAAKRHSRNCVYVVGENDPVQRPVSRRIAASRK